ncbi:hypothetical protein K438DRAFT_1826485 [Mycena galopus ATCC 62051]|nr:hypothetical protein K438DRAFT_1826485 [Mycena galopus ATCC 62051]
MTASISPRRSVSSRPHCVNFETAPLRWKAAFTTSISSIMADFCADSGLAFSFNASSRSWCSESTSCRRWRASGSLSGYRTVYIIGRLGWLAVAIVTDQRGPGVDLDSAWMNCVFPVSAGGPPF